MKQGQMIVVVDYFRDELERVVVQFDEDYVFVCSPLEWEDAKRERREPTSIGFARKYIVSSEVAA